MAVNGGTDTLLDFPLVRVADASQIGEARRRVAAATRRLAFDEVQAGRAAIVASEAASNLLKHGAGGIIVLNATPDRDRPGLEILAADRGRGIENVAESLRDGFSTAGTTGTGLGAIRRLADEFDLFTAPGHGTVVRAVVRARENAPPVRADAGEDAPSWGAVCVPVDAEPWPGDGYEVFVRAGGFRVVMADGLGHGVAAHEAARAGLDAARAATARGPTEVLEACHAAMKPTRGGAVSVADVDLERGLVRFAGVGNVAGALVAPPRMRSLVSLPGTVGSGAIRPREFTYPWSPADTLVMHTDGIRSRWDLAAYPGLLARHPAVVAAVLLRDHARGHDDASVLVAREAAR